MWKEIYMCKNVNILQSLWGEELWEPFSPSLKKIDTVEDALKTYENTLLVSELNTFFSPKRIHEFINFGFNVSNFLYNSKYQYYTIFMVRISNFQVFPWSRWYNFFSILPIIFSALDASKYMRTIFGKN